MDKTPTAKTPTRQALVEAALEVFLQRGFARATTREIAHRAGLSEGTMYRHFADKYELFHQVFLATVLEIGQELAQLPDRAGHDTLRANLAHLFSLIGRMQAKVSPLMASMWADPDLSRNFDAYLAEKLPPSFERPEPVTMVAAYVAAEQRLGRIRPDVDPQQAAALVVSLPLAAGMERALRASFTTDAGLPAPEDFPEPSEDAIAILERGLTP